MKNKTLSAQVAELELFRKTALEYAQKFVNKVEIGKARSKETYNDMKILLKLGED